MNNLTNLTDIETRITFLEDQNDGLNIEFIRLQKDNERLRQEIYALAKLIEPLLRKTSRYDDADDPMPPHF